MKARGWKNRRKKKSNNKQQQTCRSKISSWSDGGHCSQIRNRKEATLTENTEKSKLSKNGVKIPRHCRKGKV